MAKEEIQTGVNKKSIVKLSYTDYNYKKSKRRNGIRRIVKEEKKRNRKNSYRAS